MPYIDVRFHFDAEDEDGYTDYNLTSIERIGTTIPEADLNSIGEVLAQSDRWQVGGVNATLSAMVDPGGPKNPRDFE